MENTFYNKILKSHHDCGQCASNAEIKFFFENLLGLLFPVYGEHKIIESEVLLKRFDEAKNQLKNIIFLCEEPNSSQEQCADDFFNAVPTIYDYIQEDLNALFMGDPAAKSKDEVVRTYPGFYAIAAYRIAHQLYRQNIEILPRAITEIAHTRTGIDIHPGATIGKSFCIDHGTGVVIGETTEIGDHVKVYQGVTLGALSVDKKDAEKKRHPSIESNVVIYAGATILGGETVIGSGSIIGGNVWLTKSIPPNTKVYYKAQLQQINDDNKDIFIFS